MLERHGRKYVAVEADIDATSAARRAGHPVVFGDASRAELIDRLNLGRADALILTMADPMLSVRLTRSVRSWVPHRPIQIGRASFRVSVCSSLSILLVVVSLNIK